MAIMHTNQLLWLDLEMTGLKPHSDLILEVAAIVTDLDYQEKAVFDAVIRPQKDIAGMMDDIVREMHQTNGLLERLGAGIPEDAVRKDLVLFITEHFGNEPVVLCGNSIHMDRRFIEARWPDIAALLHYRMLDVSSFKILAQAKYNLEFQKNETHRALDDIRESIRELRFYEQKWRMQR